jgi:hypothetical protein
VVSDASMRQTFDAPRPAIIFGYGNEKERNKSVYRFDHPDFDAAPPPPSMTIAVEVFVGWSGRQCRRYPRFSRLTLVSRWCWWSIEIFAC